MQRSPSPRPARRTRRAPLVRPTSGVSRASTSSSLPGSPCSHGANGQGKTSLLEAIAWVARTRSFRGVSRRAARAHRARAGDRARRDRRPTTRRSCSRRRSARPAATASCATSRPSRARVTSTACCASRCSRPTTSSSVKGGPPSAACTSTSSSAMLAARYDAARTDFERVLKQRNALLRGGVRDDEARDDPRRVRRAARARRRPSSCAAGSGWSNGSCPASTRRTRRWRATAGRSAATYEAEWAPEPLERGDADDVEDRLRDALAARRRAEIDRGLTLVGPHRDEWQLDDRRARRAHQASQGEQRTLALALRLAGHDVVARRSTGTAPVLAARRRVQRARRDARSRALGAQPAAGQTLLTTAGVIPRDVVPERTLADRRGPASSRTCRRVTRRREPVPLRDALAAVGRELGMPAARRVRRRSSTRGRRSSGRDVAAPRARAFGARRRVHVEVDGPGWATQLRYLETRARRAARERALREPGVVTVA